jgi:hypothetical protein
MPTDKERRMLIRPLMKRRPDLVYHRQYVFVRPLTHYLRGVFFKSGAYGKYFTLISFVFPLFDAARYFYFRGTGDLPQEQKPFEYDVHQSWVDDPEKYSVEVCDVIEHQALPPVADVVSPEAFAKRPGYMQRCIDAALGACFNGDFDEAERIVIPYISEWKTRVADGWPDPPEHERYSADAATEEHSFHEDDWWRMAYLGKLLQTDRARIPALLHDWEDFTVNTWKLNKYWTRTPFPCEG